MGYGSNFTDQKDLLRLYLGDTDDSNLLFTDDEIRGVLEQHGDLLEAYAWLQIALSNDERTKLRKIKDGTAGGISISDLSKNRHDKGREFLG